MQKNWIFQLIFLATSHSVLVAQEDELAKAPVKNHENNVQQSLKLKRIAEYWKEGDFSTVKKQVRSFLAEFPESPFNDQLHTMLGDLLFQEKNYSDALAAYEKIEGENFQEKTQISYVHCLYELGCYEDLIVPARAVLAKPIASKDQENSIRFQLADSYYRLSKLPENSSKKEFFLKEALGAYQSLATTKYAEFCLLPMAEAYLFFEDYARASSLYLHLAQKHPEKKEELLFQVASLQVQFDKKAAIATFEKVQQMKGALAPEAAFNQISLLFEEKRYKDLLIAQEEAIQYISRDQHPIVQYYIGQSLFKVDDFSGAIAPLKKYIAAGCVDKTNFQNALLSLIACAKETHDLDLFDEGIQRFKTTFPRDERIANIQLLHAQLYLEKGDLKRAANGYKEVLALFPEHPQQEAILYDYALLLSQDKQWSKSSLAFQTFLKNFPSSAKRQAAFRHLAFCQIEQVNQANPETQKIRKEELVNTLSQALDQKKLFSSSERESLLFLLGKTQYELGRYDEALGSLSQFVTDYDREPTSGQAHLLMAHCHLKGTYDPLSFTLEAEKALLSPIDAADKNALHLQLYNAYLSLAEKETADNKSELVAQAADHLYLSLDQPVKKDNQLWLANYYFQQWKKSQGKEADVSLQRTIVTLEKLLHFTAEKSSLSISEDTLDMERETMRLSDLYTHSKRYEEKACLLQALKEQQEQHPNWDWKYQRLALFELAKAEEALGNSKGAMDTYEFLIQSAKHGHSYFAIAARLQKNKLAYAQLKNPLPSQVESLLDELKDIEVQRKLLSEPLHLEAALSYIDIKSHLAPEKQRAGYSLKLIKQMQNNFSSEEDPAVQKYFAAKEQYADKMHLFKQYMRYLSVEEKRLEASVAWQANDKESAKALQKQAIADLDTLKLEQMPDSLQERVLKCREALNRGL